MTNPDSQSSGWLNRTVLAAGLTSFLADIAYESATALLPSFLLTLNLTKESAGTALGIIEASAEFLSNASKLIVGWYSDRVGRRKELVVTGYAMTGVAFSLCAVAVSWPWVLAAKSLAWLGKGIRGPLRNAILSDSVDPADRGKAFGFHRAGDTCGAVLGPLLAWCVLAVMPPDWFPNDPSGPHRMAFWFTLIPGIGAALTFALLVREKRFTPKPGLRLGASLRAIPPGFRRFLIGVGLFGAGDFAATLLVLFATADLSGSLDQPKAVQAGVLFYAWRNFVQACAAFPAGWLGDKLGHARVLTFGYAIGAAAMAWCAAAFATHDVEHGVFGIGAWAGFFALTGVYMAIQEALEPAVTPEFVPDRSSQGTAFGILAVVNGLGDVIAVLTVGFLYQVAGVSAATAYAAILMALGAAWLAFRTKTPTLIG